MAEVSVLSAVTDTDDLPVYPIDPSERLDSHSWMPWFRRRWLNSEMRLKGDEACRAIYFDLINVAYDQSPLGTLPVDSLVLSKLALVDRDRFERLCQQPFGPLHQWTPCWCIDSHGAQVKRLMHPVILDQVLEAIAGREKNRAKNDAQSRARRVDRLRKSVAGYGQVELAKNDAAINWMHDFLVREGVQKFVSAQVERAMGAWAGHILEIQMGQR